jgi:hypothetical protein
LHEENEKPAGNLFSAGPEAVQMNYELALSSRRLVPLTVPPVPVFLLFVGLPLFVVHMLPVGVGLPLVVIDNFIVIPDVVVAVVGVVDPILRVRRTSGDHDGSSKSTSKKKRT